jgi:hypothetical protein
MNLQRSKSIEWQLLAGLAVLVCCVSILFRHEGLGATAWYSITSAFVVVYCLFGWEKASGDAKVVPAIVTVLAAVMFLIFVIFGK